ncbi:hypothetical protein [Cerasicoccus arenae]|uniref:Uncharacterized protein n=1 Tax=Cerasicoccus arenae TaxID=424488 RepID=A0A8J3DEJ7_9BACT|nr:hypothetical protein [Cerasicoccus arenae]MBK1856908.1 hypothetical protein [Cerasicoccus arenae]GHB89789.1 hypothetical protein GCM10007047_00330 [Cerasicoccus arenae]
MAVDELADLRTRAWVGDAVLALYAREWILRQKDIKPEARAQEFIHMTANDFLACTGEPTRVEAGIGDVYESDGLAAAFAYIEETLLPLYLKQRRKRR